MRFRSALRIVARNPRIGRPSSFEGVRMKTIGDYLLFYRQQEKTIIIAPQEEVLGPGGGVGVVNKDQVPGTHLPMLHPPASMVSATFGLPESRR